MSAKAFIGAMESVVTLTDGQLSAVRDMLDTVERVCNSESSSRASFLLSYRPSLRDAPLLRDSLLDAAEIEPKVPLGRIEMRTRAPHSFALLALSDSPAYTAYPPRMARETNDFIPHGWRGLDLLEGLWLTLLHPGVLSAHALDLVGAIYSLECTPTIYEWDGRRYLSAIAPDSRDQLCRPVFVRKTLRVSMAELNGPAELRRRIVRFAHVSGRRPPMF